MPKILAGQALKDVNPWSRHDYEGSFTLLITPWGYVRPGPCCLKLSSQEYLKFYLMTRLLPLDEGESGYTEGEPHAIGYEER